MIFKDFLRKHAQKVEQYNLGQGLCGKQYAEGTVFKHLYIFGAG